MRPVRTISLTYQLNSHNINSTVTVHPVSNIGFGGG